MRNNLISKWGLHIAKQYEFWCKLYNFQKSCIVQSFSWTTTCSQLEEALAGRKDVPFVGVWKKKNDRNDSLWGSDLLKACLLDSWLDTGQAREWNFINMSLDLQEEKKSSSTGLKTLYGLGTKGVGQTPRTAPDTVLSWGAWHLIV